MSGSNVSKNDAKADESATGVQKVSSTTNTVSSVQQNPYAQPRVSSQGTGMVRVPQQNPRKRKKSPMDIFNSQSRVTVNGEKKCGAGRPPHAKDCPAREISRVKRCATLREKAENNL